LGKVSLSLGALTEEVSVVAVATPIQTASSENSKLVDSSQIVDLTLKGRDMFAVLQTVPGVYFGNTYLTGGDATSEGNALGNMSINGGGGGRANFTVDGITDLDTGSNTTSHFEPTMDTIAEMRVLTTNYQAEYGRNSSGTVSVVTKGGSQEFHGSAYVNKRH
jgi:outer membrane receptor protein involved in Fe transport